MAYDTWGGSWGSSWGLSWTRADSTPTPTPTPTEVPAGRSRRKYKSITVRLNGEYVECESVERLLQLLKEIKREIPQVARAKAVELVKSGVKVSEVRRLEAKSVELVSAPEYAKDVIEKRILEIQLQYWKAIERALRALNDDDEEVILLSS